MFQVRAGMIYARLAINPVFSNGTSRSQEFSGSAGRYPFGA